MQNQTKCTFFCVALFKKACIYRSVMDKPNMHYALYLPETVTHIDAYPLSVSWPRRRTRCTSLWSTLPVKRLAWYGPFPVWSQVTWSPPRHTATHPSSTWASFPDPIGRPGCPSNQISAVLPLTLWLSPHRMDPDWAARSRPGSRPSPGVHSSRG